VPSAGFRADNNVDPALEALKKKIKREGIFRDMKRRGHYEKPSEKRVREKAEAIRRARRASDLGTTVTNCSFNGLVGRRLFRAFRGFGICRSEVLRLLLERVELRLRKLCLNFDDLLQSLRLA